MSIFSAAISNNKVGQPERLPESPAEDKVKPKSTILVIDDDPLVLQTVKTLLGKRGFHVLTASSAPKGLDILHHTAGGIRIVVLDYSMPQFNGSETLDFIKQLSPNAKVIGLTAMDLPSVTKAYLEGIDKLLKKPFVAADLVSAVNELLGDGQTASSAIYS